MQGDPIPLRFWEDAIFSAWHADSLLPQWCLAVLRTCNRSAFESMPLSSSCNILKLASRLRSACLALSLYATRIVTVGLSSYRLNPARIDFLIGRNSWKRLCCEWRMLFYCTSIGSIPSISPPCQSAKQNAQTSHRNNRTRMGPIYIFLTGLESTG